MTIYAWLNADNSVREIIEPVFRVDGSEIPIADRYHPDFVALLTVYDPSKPPAIKPVSPPTAAQLAKTALAGGLTIISTSTPTLNGTYALDQLSQMNIIAIETSLNAGKGFPGGVTMFNYLDASSAMHPFSAINFANFAAAVRDYVYALNSVIAGVSTTLPSTSTTIP